MSFLLSDNFQKIKYEQRQWEDAVELIPSKSGHLVSDHPSLGKAKESWLLTTYFLFYLKKKLKILSSEATEVASETIKCN